MAFEKKIKDPDAVLDYKVNWTSWLGLNNDTITDVEWIVPEGLEQPDDRENYNTDYTATVWLAGGELGKTYHVTNRIETAGGRINDYTFDIKVSST